MHCFWLFTLWFIDKDASFCHFFHKITNIWSWRCFSSSKIHTHFSHILQHYQDFRSNVAVGQFTQAVSLYWVYYWKIIQQRMFVVNNFHAKIRYTYTHFFHIFLKLYYWFRAIKLCEWKKFLYTFICFSKLVLASCYQIV